MSIRDSLSLYGVLRMFMAIPPRETRLKKEAIQWPHCLSLETDLSLIRSSLVNTMLQSLLGH